MSTPKTIDPDQFEKYAYIVTKISFIFMNNTNKAINGDKLRAADLRNFKDENWPEFYEQHQTILNLICTEITGTDFVLVSKETDDLPLDILMENISLKKEEPMISEEAKKLIDQELRALGDGEEPGLEIDLFSDILDSLKKPEVENNLGNEKIEDYLEKYGQEIAQTCASVINRQVKIPEQILNSERKSDIELDLHLVKNNIDAETSTSLILSQEAEPEQLSLKEEIDPEFEKKLEEQRKGHQEELLKIKEEKQRKQKEYEKELKKIRHQQKQCFKTLISCITMKKRFEEKEREVADWIEACYKKPVSKLLGKFMDFEDFAREQKQFKKISSVLDVRQEVMGLHEKICCLMDTLEQSFDQLQKISEIDENAGFVRVLQKCISDHAKHLILILDVLNENNFNFDWFKNLQNHFELFTNSKIPTTQNLRKICGKPGNKDFEIVNFPEKEQTVIIEEVSEPIFSKKSRKRACSKENVTKSSKKFNNSLNTSAFGKQKLLL